MHFREFESREQMVDHLDAVQAKHPGLHPAQQDIITGDYWVRFIGGDRAIVQFGFVAKDEGEFLYGLACSRNNREGSLGSITRADVWPIEVRTFDAALRVRWDVAALPTDATVDLEVAYRALQGHMRNTERQGS